MYVTLAKKEKKCIYLWLIQLNDRIYQENVKNIWEYYSKFSSIYLTNILSNLPVNNL